MMKRWKEVSPPCVQALETPTLTDTTVDRSGNPTCVRSVVCMSSNGQGISWNVNPSGLYNGTNNVRRVQWRSNPLNLSYKPEYPFTLIPGANGAVSIGIDTKDNLWVVQRAPVGVDAISKFDSTGKLRGICPDCDRMIYRTVNPQMIDAVLGDLDVTFTQAGTRIEETTIPNVNCNSIQNVRQ